MFVFISEMISEYKCSENSLGTSCDFITYMYWFLIELECILRILSPCAAVLVSSPDSSMRKVWGRDTVVIDLVPKPKLEPKRGGANDGKMDDKLH